MDNLQKRITDIVSDPQHTDEQLVNALDPISIYTDNEVFISHVDDIVNFITTDRNGDNEFSMKDVELLCKDPKCIRDMIQMLVIIIKSIPNVQLKYTEDETEILIYKLFIYIMFISVPSKTGCQYTDFEIKALLNLCGNVYTLSTSTRIVRAVFSKVNLFFKSHSFCSCLCANNKNDIAENELAEAKVEFMSDFNGVRERAEIDKKVDKLSHGANQDSSVSFHDEIKIRDDPTD